MKTTLPALILALCLAAAPAQARRNIVIFVADGLRYASVTPKTAPAMARIRREGVDFTNSHAMYPTLTTANASAIATGHYVGDTGDYANTLFVGFPVACNYGEAITFLEDDCVLKDIKAHYPDGYLAQTTLMQAARAAGYNTVIVGKRGPAAIQDLTALDSRNEDVEGPLGIFIDDGTNHAKTPDGMPMKSTMLTGQMAGDIFGATGEAAPALTSTPNLTQQSYMLSAVSQVLIPELSYSQKPFLMMFWSRDPDATQHGAQDSNGRLIPGINSYSGRAAIANADNDLKGILSALEQYGLSANTDVFVIADHGFSTITKGIPDAQGTVARNTLGDGFLAADVADWLKTHVFDVSNYNHEVDRSNGERPSGASLVGPTADRPDAIVVANGGSDFIYLPEGANRRDTARRIFAGLTAAPYVGALFVNDTLLKGGGAKDFAGALPMSDINMIGSSNLPEPAFVVGFRSFVVKGCKLGAQMCTAEIADTPLAPGQGMHGSFSRADTRNFMAAIGPDFKARYADGAPVSNADVAPTLAHIIGVDLKGPGNLKGRVATEALKSGGPVQVRRSRLVAPPAANGLSTVVDVETVGATRYFDAGGVPGRTVGLSTH